MFHSFLRCINFCPDFFGYVENCLLKKLNLISKFMMLQTGKIIIAMHILPNVTSPNSFSQEVKAIKR